MIEEMGISPDPSIRSRRPTFKAAALSVMFCLRTKKAATVWGESKKIQEALARKMEARRERGKRILGR